MRSGDRTTMIPLVPYHSSIPSSPFSYPRPVLSSRQYICEKDGVLPIPEFKPVPIGKRAKLELPLYPCVATQLELVKVLFRYFLSRTDLRELSVEKIAGLASHHLCSDFTLVEDEIVLAREPSTDTFVRLDILLDDVCVDKKLCKCFGIEYKKGWDDKWDWINGGHVPNTNVSPVNTLAKSIVRNTKLIVDDFMLCRGYEWNGYFGYVNVFHPFHQAWIGNIPITPETFGQCTKPEFLMRRGEFNTMNLGDYTDCKDNDEWLKNKAKHASHPGNVGTSWNSKQLKEAILKRCVLGGKAKKVLTLELITGNEEDRITPLPGFNIMYYGDDVKVSANEVRKFYAKNKVRLGWHETRGSVGYYLMCYQALNEMLERREKKDGERKSIRL